MKSNKIELKDKFYNEIVKEFKKKFGVKNDLAVTVPVKVVVNIGLSEALKNKAVLEEVENWIALITGQKPVYTRAKKSIAEFSLRKGDIIGLKVTLRKDRMWYFLSELINIVIPRIKDFRGINPDAFDKYGNYTLGIVDYVIFPEVDPAKIDKNRGLSINIQFENGSPEKSRFVMEKLGFIFKR